MNVKDLPIQFDNIQEIEILRLDLPIMDGRKIKSKGIFIFRCNGEYFSIDTPYWWTQNFPELFSDFKDENIKFIFVQREIYNDGRNGRLKYLGDVEDF